MILKQNSKNRMSRILGRKVLFQFASIRSFQFSKERQRLRQDEYDLIKKVNNLSLISYVIFFFKKEN